MMETTSLWLSCSTKVDEVKVKRLAHIFTYNVKSFDIGAVTFLKSWLLTLVESMRPGFCHVGNETMACVVSCENRQDTGCHMSPLSCTVFHL